MSPSTSSGYDGSTDELPIFNLLVISQYPLVVITPLMVSNDSLPELSYKNLKFEESWLKKWCLDWLFSENNIPGTFARKRNVLLSLEPYKLRVPSVEKIAIALLSKSSFLHTANWPLLFRPKHQGSVDWLLLSSNPMLACLDDPVVSINIL